MQKDWTGNKSSIFATLAATSHGQEERQKHDYYATDPKAINVLIEECGVKFSRDIWECACGEGHMSKELKKYGYNVRSTDLVDRGYGEEEIDFLQYNELWHGDIVTNPPYKYGQEFIEHALAIIPDGNKVAMFLKVQFLEGKARKNMFKNNPPKYVFVSSSRLNCAKNGDFDKCKSSAVAYAWYIWEKGYKGKTVVEWVN